MAVAPQDLLDAKEAAERYGIHLSTLVRRMTLGQLQPTETFRHRGMSVHFFSEEDLEEHFAEYPVRDVGMRARRS